ncbi:hypothetical protein PLEOSDRAFT_170056 [Pleurotus ostreatus PC15]|uniref:Uncharacterized protein n=1 Tax=Pleurotus ostreatus (strain PC15) TaxID=1137138 RepID=A0A067NDJ7_PLEO1|nr:hypothetical protein PLEOSDRAFT_170056 [Pleurotus ostreatus PC15]
MSSEYGNKEAGALAVGNGKGSIISVASRQSGSKSGNEHDGTSKPAPAVGNYPPGNDTTLSGGYCSANVRSDRVQRGNPDRNINSDPAITESQPFGGLIDQSLNGTSLKSGLADAKQGVDKDTRRDIDPLNPYGKSSYGS